MKKADHVNINELQLWDENPRNCDAVDFKRLIKQIKDLGQFKPVALFEKAISNSSQGGEIVADLLGGSGSTLIACEKLNRKCRMMEIDPVYCQVIIDRWEEFSGKHAEKLTGK